MEQPTDLSGLKRHPDSTVTTFAACGSLVNCERILPGHVEMPVAAGFFVDDRIPFPKELA
jgi:hypothetical protein